MRSRLILYVLSAAIVPLLACSVSQDQEVAIGQQNAAQVNAQLPLLRDPVVLQYVNDLGRRIASHTSRADLDWHFFVVDSREVNAFALPGGFVYVNRGLIERAERMDQLAGTMGHEIGHVVRRHSVRQMESAQRANIGVALACTLTRVCGGVGARVAIGVAGNAWFARHSRLDEAQADSEAVVNTTASGISPRGIPELFAILLQERQTQPTLVDAFFASHPLEESRITATRHEIAQYPARLIDTLQTDERAFHDFQARLRALPRPPTPAAQYDPRTLPPDSAPDDRPQP